MQSAFRLALALILAGALPLQAQQNDEEKKPVFTKRIVVSAKRLADEGMDLDKVPANVTVITREDIQKSGARTLQEFLAAYSGVILYDNVGNGAEATIDLRGFSDGTAMAVYIDGVRVNEPDDNRVNLEFIDLDTVERIEIIPGGGSVSHGSGALSGVLKIFTRRGYGGPKNELEASYGSFGTVRAGVRSGSRMGRHSYFLSYKFMDSDGHRENGRIRQSKVLGKYNFDVPESHNVEIAYRYYTGELGNPGALTPQELAEDRRQNPFNPVDFNNSDESVLSLRYTQYFAGHVFVTAVGYRRDANIEVLTTGRAAALFGGFRSKSDHSSTGTAVLAGYRNFQKGWSRNFTAGFEVSSDRFNNVGHFTDLAGSPSAEAGNRSTEQNNQALFIQGSVSLGERLTLSGGLRHDDVDMAFDDLLLGQGESRKFSKATASAGATFSFSESVSTYIRYAQAFQIPTVNDLFAFPLFGSNPHLEPVAGTTYEGGVRAVLGKSLLLQASVFRMDLENEIVFVITDPVWFIGRNENVGESRRAGLELQLSGRPQQSIDLLASYSYTKSQNISLAEELGAGELRIPMVPSHRLSLRVNYSLGNLSLGAEGLYTGSQVMSSDQANLGPLLDSYFLLNLRSALKMNYLTVKLDLLNVLDREYETRGFYSYGYYLTPGPGRAVTAGVEFRY